jgi:hypothetical protein
LRLGHEKDGRGGDDAEKEEFPLHKGLMLSQAHMMEEYAWRT